MEDTASNGISPSLGMPIPKTVSAEDLLGMYDEEVKSSAEEIDSEASKQAKIAAEVPKKVAANNIVKKLEAQSEEKADKPTVADENLEQTEEKEATEGEEDDDIPTFKAKFEDEEFEVPEEAVIPAEVNGKKIEVKVKDAVKALVNQEKWNRELDRRLSVVSDREKRFSRERQDIQANLKRVAELAEQGDHLMGIRVLAEMAGKDPVEYEKQVLSTLEKLTSIYSNMNEEQRNAHFATRKAEYLEKKLKEKEEQVLLAQEKEDLRGRVAQLRKENDISEAEFVEGYKELVSLIEQKVAPDDVSPEAVINHLFLAKHVQKVGAAINNVNKDLAKDPEFVDYLIRETKSNRDFSVSDIEQIIRDVLSVDSKSVENLNRKVQKGQVHGLRAQSDQASSERKQVEGHQDDELYEYFFGKAKIAPSR